jgi:hypothetical protein
MSATHRRVTDTAAARKIEMQALAHAGPVHVMAVWTSLHCAVLVSAAHRDLRSSRPLSCRMAGTQSTSERRVSARRCSTPLSTALASRLCSCPSLSCSHIHAYSRPAAGARIDRECSSLGGRMARWTRGTCSTRMRVAGVCLSAHPRSGRVLRS